MSDASEAAAPTAEAAPESSFDAAVAAAMAIMPQHVDAEQPVVTESATTAPAEQLPAVVPPPAAPVPDLRLGELEARLKASEEALAAANAKPAADWNAFLEDPIGTIRRSKPDLTPAQAAKVAESLYFHALGDQAPAEYRMRQELNAKVDPKVAALESQIAELKSQRESETRAAQITAYQSELRTHGAQLPAEKFPILANLAKRSPERLTSVMYEIAVREAQESHRKGGQPVVLSPAEAADRAEKLLAAQRDELYGPPPVAAPQATASPPSMFGRNTNAQPTRTPPSTMDDKALRAAALRAAGINIPAWD